MTKPWPITKHPGGWSVDDGEGLSVWLAEEPARRYAATPLLIEAVRNACERHCCAFCGATTLSGHAKHVISGAGKHAADCLGIAALRAAGETP